MAISSSPATSVALRSHAAFIWSEADLLRSDYKQFEYGKVILPLAVLRRLDCILEAVFPSAPPGTRARESRAP